MTHCPTPISLQTHYIFLQYDPWEREQLVTYAFHLLASHIAGKSGCGRSSSYPELVVQFLWLEEKPMQQEIVIGSADQGRDASSFRISGLIEKDEMVVLCLAPSKWWDKSYFGCLNLEWMSLVLSIWAILQHPTTSWLVLTSEFR